MGKMVGRIRRKSVSLGGRTADTIYQVPRSGKARNRPAGDKLGKMLDKQGRGVSTYAPTPATCTYIQGRPGIVTSRASLHSGWALINGEVWGARQLKKRLGHGYLGTSSKRWAHMCPVRHCGICRIVTRFRGGAIPDGVGSALGGIAPMRRPTTRRSEAPDSC